MNDPVEFLQESILGPRYGDKRTLMRFEAEYQAREHPVFSWRGTLHIVGKPYFVTPMIFAVPDHERRPQP